MGLNTLMEDLQNKLINDINNSQLPVGIVYYVAKDVFSQIEKEYQKELEIEKEETIENGEKTISQEQVDGTEEN
jgi:hypothetical protein